MDDEYSASERPSFDQPTHDIQDATPLPLVPEEVEPSTVGEPNMAFGSPIDPLAVRPPQPSSPKPQVKRKKWQVATGVVAVVVVLMAAGLAYAYSWYQNPQWVILDGVSRALQATSLVYTGNIDSTQPDNATSLALKFSGVLADGNAGVDMTINVTAAADTFSLHGKGAFDKSGAAYVRLDNVDQAYRDYIQSNTSLRPPEGSEPLVEKMIAKFDNKWIKIEPSDLNDFGSDGSGLMTCLEKASETFRKDPNVRKELGSLYQKHAFIRIDEELAPKNGSLGYVISADESKEKAFIAEAKQTKIYKQIHDCDSRFTIDESDVTIGASNNQRTEVWLSQWRHEITKVVVRQTETNGGNMNLTWEPSFNTPANVEIPKEFVTLSALQADIQELVSDYMLSTMGPPDAPATASSTKL